MHDLVQFTHYLINFEQLTMKAKRCNRLISIDLLAQLTGKFQRLTTEITEFTTDDGHSLALMLHLQVKNNLINVEKLSELTVFIGKTIFVNKVNLQQESVVLLLNSIKNLVKNKKLGRSEKQ